MRGLINLGVIAGVAVLGAALWLSMPFDADTMENPAGAAAPEMPEGFHIEGMQGGYLIPAEPFFAGEIELSSITIEPPLPDCDQPAMAFVFATVESAMTGWIHYRVEFLSVTADGIEIRAVSDEAPDLLVRGEFDKDGLASWQSGADSVERLAIASIAFGDNRQEDVVLNFWIGD